MTWATQSFAFSAFAITAPVRHDRLFCALKELKPDCLLIEGPPDADEIIADCAQGRHEAAVAILVYDEETPSHAVYYPLADFSPEWQAMRWAQAAKIPVRFMDLPQWHRIAIEAAREKSPPDAAASPSPEPHDSSSSDPLGELARAAGFDDGERWWEHVVEHRRDDSAGLFDAIRDAMAELRQSRTTPRGSDEPPREAWMRRTIRAVLAGRVCTHRRRLRGLACSGPGCRIRQEKR